MSIITMTKSAYLNARLEPELKANAERVFKGLGVSTSEAVSIFLHQVVLHQGFPFPLTIPNAQTRESMAENHTKLKGYGNGTKMMNEILSESD